MCEHSNGTVEAFEKVAYVYKNNDAIDHMFRVGTGLESQILGDFEIIGQIKNSAALSNKFNLLKHLFRPIGKLCDSRASKLD